MKLAYLMFATNSAYCTVVEAPPDHVIVDLDKGTWRYTNLRAPQAERIGRGRYLADSHHGVIGVYDLENMQHVKSMVHDAIESQRDYQNAD